jgi:hypothetical protein
MLMAITAQYRALDDRLWITSQLTNGNEAAQPNTALDATPGFINMVWYDFGGSWNEERKRWDLWGESLSDLNYSLSPTVRVGAAANLVPMGRRSIYGDAEQSRVLTAPAGPGGTRLINLPRRRGRPARLSCGRPVRLLHVRPLRLGALAGLEPL